MPAKKKSAKKPAHAKPVGARETAPEVTYIDALHARLPHPTNDERRAFEAQCLDPHKDELGAETQAPNVAREVRAMIKSAEPVVRAHRDAVPYSPQRLSYFADLLQALEAAVAAQKHGHDDARTSLSSVEASTAAARKVRAWLFGALEKVTTGDADGQTLLHAARGGTADTGEQVAQSLLDAVALARGWLNARGTKWPLLCADRLITAGRLDGAERAGKALERAIDAKSVARSHGDTPAVNRLEGHVLFEAERLYVAIVEARTQGLSASLPKLGPTLRRMVVDRPRHRSAPAASTGGTPPTGGTASGAT